MPKQIDFKVPENDRSLFIYPLCINDSLLEFKDNACDLKLGNKLINCLEFNKLKENTRNEVIEIAIKYTKRIFNHLKTELKFNSNLDVNNSTLIVTGHAPMFYTPGIWIKNYLVSHLAQKETRFGLNVIMDNDCPPNDLMSVPDLSGEFASVTHIKNSNNQTGMPYEECENVVVEKSAPGCAFPLEGKRLSELIKSKCNLALRNHETLAVNKYIELIKKGEEFSKNAGEVLTFARRAFEIDFNITNLEIPVSKIAETEGFYHFLLSIIIDHCRFVDIYNNELAKYRKEKKIRSSANPFPDLKVNEEIYELPFWGWHENGTRGTIYVRQINDLSLELLSNDLTCIGIVSTSGGGQNLEAIKKIVKTGFKIRPKAVTNTIFLRIFLSDVFVHGIGGAKYDLITDKIVKRFYDITPPGYITITSTLYPVLKTYNVKNDELQKLESDLKKMNYNPDKYIPDDLIQNKVINDLVEEKYKLIADNSVNGKREKFTRIKEINLDLCNHIRQTFIDKELKIEMLKKKLAHNKVINDRGYPIFIYPEKYIKEFYDEVLAGF